MSEHTPWARAIFAEQRAWLACYCGWNAMGDATGTWNEHAELDVDRLARALEAAMSGQHVVPPALRSEFGLPPIWEPLAASVARAYADLPSD